MTEILDSVLFYVSLEAFLSLFDNSFPKNNKILINK